MTIPMFIEKALRLTEEQFQKNNIGLFLVGWMIILIWFLLDKRLRKEKGLLAFCLYSWFVLGITLFRYDEYKIREINLNLYFGSLRLWEKGGRHRTLYTILNILLFIPWGGLLHLWKKKSIFFCAAAGFCLSLLIEITQLVTARGATELVDLITNTLGAFLGAAIMWAILTIGQNVKNGRE